MSLVAAQRFRVTQQGLTIGATAVLLALALTGCGGKSAVASASGSLNAPSKAAVSLPAVTSHAPTSTTMAPRSQAPSLVAAGTLKGATPTRSCYGKDIAATINGQGKCLQAGQDCQSKAAAQYPAYGFDCLQSGTRWVLHKRA